MQPIAPSRPGDPAGDCDDPAAHGRGGKNTLVGIPNPGKPAEDVVGQSLQPQPGGVGAEVPRGEVI